MNYGTVCSGIEAPSVAWHALGWRPQFFSEIEKFPCRVLAARWPGVPNLGDLTKFHEWPEHTIDLLAGGTPCQSFSVAGLRKGLADPRGNLMLTYLALAARARPRWLVWENVPGVLSSNGGRDFGAFLGGLAELGYGFAYRVLDAQYVRVESHARAVPQRRRRVFVVGYLGDWRRAAAVLFERASLRGDPAPRREAGQGVAPTISARTQGGGGLRTDFDCDGGLICAGTGQAGTEILRDLSPTLNCNHEQPYIAGKIAPPLTGHPYGDNESRESLLVAHALRGAGFDASEDGPGRGTPLVPVACFDGRQVTSAENRGQCKGEVSGTCHAPPQTIAFSSKDHGADASEGVSPTLRAMGHGESHANGGGQVAVAFDLRGREGGAQMEGPHDTAAMRAASGGSSRSYVATRMAVRRLTPLECERLQGFPDGYTAIAGAKDGPRYKALGNSMACNVMRWIGERIAGVELLPGAEENTLG